MSKINHQHKNNDLSSFLDCTHHPLKKTDLWSNPPVLSVLFKTVEKPCLEDSLNDLNVRAQASALNQDKDLHTEDTHLYVSPKEQEDQLKEAYQMGYQEALKLVQKWQDKYQDTILSLQSLREQVMDAHLHDSMKLALVIGQELAQKTLSVDPDVIKKIITRAVQEMKMTDKMTIRVSVFDYPVVSQFKKEDIGLLRHQEFELISDENLSVGSCVVDNHLCKIDFTFETRVRQIMHALGILVNALDKEPT